MVYVPVYKHSWRLMLRRRHPWYGCGTILDYVNIGFGEDLTFLYTHLDTNVSGCHLQAIVKTFLESKIPEAVDADVQTFRAFDDKDSNI